MPHILFAAQPQSWDKYSRAIKRALDDAGIQDVKMSMDVAPDLVDYIIYSPNSGLTDFSTFPNLRAVLSLWAGVERIVGNPTLIVPLARMVDDGLREGMAEWVTGHVLRHHLGMDAHIINPSQVWDPTPPPLARDRTVAILGLGALGQACASALLGLNFKVTGWSRRKKNVPGLQCFSGPEGLREVLSTAEICVLLLPATPQTQNTLNAETLALLPKGACIINPGRGTLIDDNALLAALDRGHIGHATLDVFRTEPLPPAHAYWHHRKVTVTPHIASETRANTAADVIAANIIRAESGQPLLHLVDPTAGY